MGSRERKAGLEVRVRGFRKNLGEEGERRGGGGHHKARGFMNTWPEQRPEDRLMEQTELR